MRGEDFVDGTPTLYQFSLDDYDYDDLAVGANVAAYVDDLTQDPIRYDEWNDGATPTRNSFFQVVASPAFYWDDVVSGSAAPQIQSKVELQGYCRGTLITFDPATFVLGSFPKTVNTGFYVRYARDDPWPGSAFPDPVSAEYISLGIGETQEITVDLPTIDSGNQANPVSIKMFRFDKHPSEFDWYPL